MSSLVLLPDGKLPNEEQISEAIENLFNKKFRHCKSVWYDDFLRFCVAIGPYNAARLKSIDISGTFEVAGTWFRRVSFAKILPVYTTIMSGVCNSLTKITLHKEGGDDTWGYDYNENDYDENGDEIEGLVRKTDDERISDAVEKLMKELPQLKQLQLRGPGNGNRHAINAVVNSGLYMNEGWELQRSGFSLWRIELRAANQRVKISLPLQKLDMWRNVTSFLL